MSKESVKVHQDKSYHDESFTIDECVFVRCTLKNCDFFYSGGDTEWVETKFENCRFHWRGAAKNTFALLQVLGLIQQQPPSAIPQTVGKPN
jgi:hypothetical protein